MSNYLKKLSLAGVAAGGFLLIAAASGFAPHG